MAILIGAKSAAASDMVVSMGDSITAGYLLDDPAACYVNRLANFLGRTAVNEGISGEGSADGAGRVDAILGLYKPRYLTIYYGNNDVGYEPAAAIVDNLRYMAERCLQNGMSPVLATLGPQFGAWAWRMPGIAELNGAIRQLAAEKGLPLADLEAALNGDIRLYADDIHPNSAGHGVIAQTFFQVMIVDNTSPMPNPPVWEIFPAAQGPWAVTMKAAAVTDALSPPVQYYFRFVGSGSGGAGGSDSGWQVSRTYTDAGLQPGHSYAYQVKARDSATPPNETQYSTVVSVRTGTPGDVTGDRVVDLRDAVAVLRIMSGGLKASEEIRLSADADGDGKIGLPEAIYIMQAIAELR